MFPQERQVTAGGNTLGLASLNNLGGIGGIGAVPSYQVPGPVLI